MSGGSLDYVYSQVENAASQIKDRAENPLQESFADHLFKVARALKDLEWHYSCDTRDPEPESVQEIVSPQDVLSAAMRRAELVHVQLMEALENAKGLK